MPFVNAPDTKRYDVGIAGAGQLARMTALAAWPLGITVAVLGRLDEPAAGVAHGLVEGDWRDADAVVALGRACRVVTLENEFVDALALAHVAANGTPVRPDPASIAIVQDKARQKDLLASAGLPLPHYLLMDTAADLDAAGRDLGWPLMLKRRRLGYDGYGNATCTNIEIAQEAFAKLTDGDGVLAERWVPFERELAVMVARRPGGQALAYPVVETIQRDHVCRRVDVPAGGNQDQLIQAREIALAATETALGIGVTGVELFALPGGEVLINEIAPRPHNSGHFTIEACETSQFENHLRGVLDLPLGPVDLRVPAAVMVNILGSRNGHAVPRREALAVSGAHLHLYDKREVRVRRKMGHVTVLGATLEEARERAERAAAAVGL